MRGSAGRRSSRAPAPTPLLVGILGFLSMGSAFATDVYLPALPDVERDLAASPSLVQLTLTVFIVAQAAGNLVVGPMSDRWGRWSPLLCGSVVFVGAGVGAALAGDIWTLIAMRALQGFGSAAGPVIARAVVADVAEGQRAARLFGLLMVLFGFAPVIAPVLGGPLAEWGGWRAGMWGIVVLSLVALVSVLLLPETLPADRRRAVRLRGVVSDFASLVRNRHFFTYALIVMAAFGIILTWLATSSFVLQGHYGLSPVEYSIAFGVNSAGFLLAGVLNSLLLRRYRPEQLLVGSAVTAVAAASALLVLAVLGALPFWLLLSLVTLSFGATAPLMSSATALGLAAVRSDEVGTASALLGAIEYVLPAAIAPILGQFGVTPIPMAIGFVAYAAFVVVLLVRLSALPAAEGRSR